MIFTGTIYKTNRHNGCIYKGVGKTYFFFYKTLDIMCYILYDILNNKQRGTKKMKKDLMQNFSFSIYLRTRERYLEFKKENNLTHDEAINLLLDKYEEENKNVCK